MGNELLPPKFFNTHDPDDLRAHAMSCPENTRSVPQTKTYHTEFFQQLLTMRNSRSMLQRARGSRRECGIIHSQRDKTPSNYSTREFPKPIHLFHSLGFPTATRVGCVVYWILHHNPHHMLPKQRECGNALIK